MKRWMWIALVVIVAVGGFFAWRTWSSGQAAAAAQAGLQTEALARGELVAKIGASGTVRARQTAQLTWLTSGSVELVRAAVGDSVEAGAVLADLAQTSLAQNVILAQADLVNAQRALEDLQDSSLQQAQARQAVQNAQRALDDAQDPALAQAKAQQAVADATRAVQYAEQALRSAQSPANPTTIDEAEAQAAIARSNRDAAWDKYKPYQNKPEDNLTRARLLSDYAAAQQAYDFAVRQLNSLQGTASDTDLAIRQANLATAQAQLATAQREWERVKDGTSPAELAALEAQLADAQRQYERMADGADPAEIAAAEARVAAAQATLNQAHITAPFAGKVTQATSQAGDQVTPGTPAFRIDDLSALLVDVQVSEVDVNQMQVGQTVALTFDSILGVEYHGKVTAVAPVGEVVQNVVNFTVTVELTDADEQVRPGMTAAVTVTVQELEDVLLIPNRAVRAQEGQRVVYVLRDGFSEMVPITIGQSSDTYSELLEGDLQEGDQIILSPPSDLFTPGSAGQREMFQNMRP